MVSVDEFCKSPKMKKLAEKIRARVDAANEVPETEMYRKLKTRLTDVDSGKVIQDVVCYAIQTIKDDGQARNFFEGYTQDIKENPQKYPPEVNGQARKYAAYDISIALGHFTVAETINRWENIINEVRPPFKYVKKA